LVPRINSSYTSSYISFEDSLFIFAALFHSTSYYSIALLLLSYIALEDIALSKCLCFILCITLSLTSRIHPSQLSLSTLSQRLESYLTQLDEPLLSDCLCQPCQDSSVTTPFFGQRSPVTHGSPLRCLSTAILSRPCTPSTVNIMIYDTIMILLVLFNFCCLRPGDHVPTPGSIVGTSTCHTFECTHCILGSSWTHLDALVPR
jgi:hypothetical protein